VAFLFILSYTPPAKPSKWRGLPRARVLEAARTAIQFFYITDLIERIRDL
jgi:hypothetical protein